MGEKFSRWKAMRERLGALWDEAEGLVARFFEIYRAGDKTIPATPQNTAPTDDAPLLPKMTDFNIIISALKRIQEARIALIKEDANYETLARTDEANSEGTQEEISRILKALEENNRSETTDEDAMSH